MTHSPTVRIGIDAGLTLTKLAIETEDGDIRFEKLPSADRKGAVERVAELLEPCNTPNVGLTGGGATQLSTALPTASAAIGEFAAWGSGARNLVAESGAFSATDEPAPQRFMMVSLGTGTSVLLVDAYLETGQVRQAESLIGSVLSTASGVAGVGMHRLRRIELLMLGGQEAEAEVIALELVDGSLSRLGTGRPSRIDTLERLAIQLRVLGHEVEADFALARADSLRTPAGS